MGIKEVFENMSEDVKAKLKNTKTKEDLEALLKEENIEITSEQLDELAGGNNMSCIMFGCPLHHGCPLQI